MSDNIAMSEQVPAELWMYIFELLESTKDLNSIVRTCLRFHNYAIRAMHRRLIWKTPRAFAYNAPFWQGQSEAMIKSVQSLEMHVSTLSEPIPGTLVGEDGNMLVRADPNPNFTYPEGPWIEEDPHDVHNMPIMRSMRYYKINQTFATPELYTMMMNRMVTFTHLRTLLLNNLFFTDELFEALHTLPRLNSLHIELCFFPQRQNLTLRDHSTLPITELTLLNLRRQVLRGGNHGDDENHAFADMDEDITPALNLALAHNLRILRVDSTADVFANVYRKRLHGAYTYTVPEHLEQLYVMRKHYVKGVVQPMYHSEQLFPLAVYSVMEKCNNLTTVSSSYPLPKHHNFPKNDSLPKLSRCEGVLDTVSVMTANRPIKALSILRSESSTENILDALLRKSRQHPDLRMLAIHCKSWDLEVLDAICQLFPDLRKLRITFDQKWEHRHPAQLYDFGDTVDQYSSCNVYLCGTQGPSEDMVVSFGPHYLHRLTKLHTVHIFAMPSNFKVTHPPFLYDRTFGSVEEELQNLVIPWNRYCKSLREVQLHSGYAMRRGYEGAPWSLHKEYGVSETSDFKY